MATQADIRQQITDQIVEALKKGLAPWRQPWVNHPNAGLPSNVISKHRYNGVNAVLLGLISMDQGYQSKHRVLPASLPDAIFRPRYLGWFPF